MNKLLIICLFVLGLLTIAACGNTNSNSGTTSPTSTVSTSNNNGVASASDNGVASIPDTNNVASPATNENIQKISDIQKPENVNQTVTVQGKVLSTLKSSRLNISGYKIQDSTGTIDVSSPKQPAVNSTVTVTGTLYQSTFFGIVIRETG